MKITNSSNRDICVLDYLFPSPEIRSNIFLIEDRLGYHAEYIGEEAVIIGGDMTVISPKKSVNLVIDLAGSYDLSKMPPPLTVRYNAPFEAC